ncbi:MAG: hypothetical protein LLG14_19895 [Nocardiaceae bacterium]|nr:hypothetical protein [Nocardiaceae bacterium]
MGWVVVDIGPVVVDIGSVVVESGTVVVEALVVVSTVGFVVVCLGADPSSELQPTSRTAMSAGTTPTRE